MKIKCQRQVQCEADMLGLELSRDSNFTFTFDATWNIFWQIESDRLRFWFDWPHEYISAFPLHKSKLISLRADGIDGEKELEMIVSPSFSSRRSTLVTAMAKIGTTGHGTGSLITNVRWPKFQIHKTVSGLFMVQLILASQWEPYFMFRFMCSKNSDNNSKWMERTQQ